MARSTIRRLLISAIAPWPQAPKRTGPRSAAVLVRRMRASTKSCCIRASTQPTCNNPPQHEIVMPQRDVTQRRPRLPPRGAGRADGNACARGCGFEPSSPRVGVAAFTGAAPNSLFDDRATFVFAPPRPCAGPPRLLPSDFPSDVPSDWPFDQPSDFGAALPAALPPRPPLPPRPDDRPPPPAAGRRGECGCSRRGACASAASLMALRTVSPSGSGATGTALPSNFSMAFNAPRSAGSQNAIAIPVAPARPVRPMRCT